jgi:hypothetical protein
VSLGYKVFFGAMILLAVFGIGAYLIERHRANKERGMFHQYGIGDDEE